MNATELARQLKTTTEELFDQLPKLGFDIGRKAIKIDDKIAQKIIKSWKLHEKEKRERQKIDSIRGSKIDEENDKEKSENINTDIAVPQNITIREFANKLSLPINVVLANLMKNGVLTSMNEKVDFDTASIIGEELGFNIIPLEEGEMTDIDNQKAQKKLKAVLMAETGLESRPPVVVVMGHVDHGKTKILDAIRQSDVISGESGGITQHIGAYQITKNNKTITFIDTPGHEAFTAMRSRGARIADIAILVVAADDSIQPQTKEAIKIIQDAKIPFVVAINKIDKPEANIEKVKKDLASLNLLPDDWGGKISCVPVSALQKTGIDDLVETITLISEMEQEHIKANPNDSAIGTIIESHIDKGEGPVATILVQSGTLKLGDVLAMNDSYYGKVRNLKDYQNQEIKKATPGTPVKILGLKIAPEVGTVMEVSSNIKNLNRDIRQQKIRQEKDFSIVNANNNNHASSFVNLIIRADVLGSLEAIIESLAKMETKDTKIKIIGKGLGSITESDILKAEATGSLVIGFHVKAPANVAELARDKNIEIKFYQVIYHLIEEVKKKIDELKVEEIQQKLIGKLEVLKIFKTETNHMIIGGRVIDGNIVPTETVIITRNNEALSTGQVKRVECSKEMVNKVSSGQECGVDFEGKGIIKEGDVLEFYQKI